MKKQMTKLCSLAFAGVMAVSTTSILTACSKKGGLDNEKDALVIASSEFDGVFSPFFSTSAYDSEVVGQTQIGMLTIDESGELAYGKDYPVVTLDYFWQTYDKAGNPLEGGDEDGTTVYQFVLKNGIKFSDGKDLTIKDVLFSLYSYLDPVYTGSSTIYSTDIVGLAKYRTQNPNADEDASDSFDETFRSEARTRVNNLYEMLKKTKTLSGDELVQAQKDLETLKSTFKTELTNDYVSAQNSLEDYEDEYPFTEVWQLYLYTEGVAKLVPNKAGTGYEKENGKYKIDYCGAIDAMEEDTLYSKKDKDACIQFVFDNYTSAGSEDRLAQVLKYWSYTPSEMLSTFTAEQKNKYFEDLRDENDGSLLISSIEGIKAKKGSEFKGTANYSDEYDMLEITINGVDPKAVWNFSYSVVPMHYYSTPEETVKANNVDNFGVDMGNTEFFNQMRDKSKVPVGAGVYKASSLKGSSGQNSDYSYLADNFYINNFVYFERNEYFYTCLGDGKDVSNNAKIKYLRYKVVPTQNTMEAVKSGNVHYAAPNATQDNMDFLNANTGTLGYNMTMTSGYGYIGINSKYIKNINVRRAIMTTMNTGLVRDYYQGDLCKLLYRPMTLVSWVYNADDPSEGNVEAYVPKSKAGNANETYYGYDETFELGRAYMEAAGYEQVGANSKGEGGKWRSSDGEYLKKIVFTVAGDSQDHPAYQTLTKSAEILNKYGFDVYVKTDSQALNKLSTGSLTVWAAAWSAGLDPDMYQVYHKNSNATSVKNWGYDWLIDQNGADAEEAQIINDLSALIDEGRETLNQSARKITYRSALDLVMELAVELPLYQRNDLYVYNTNYIDETSLYATPGTYYGLMAELWKVSLKVK